MKKILPAIIALTLVSTVALTACGKKDMKPENDSSTTESTTKSTTNLSQKADEFADDMKTTIDNLKSDVSEMMPGSDKTTNPSSTTDTANE